MLINNQKVKLLKGIGLVEVIASIGVAALVVTALVSLSVFTLRASSQGKVFFEASKLANSEIEKIRALRDSCSTWSDFISEIEACQSATNLCSISTSSSASNNCELSKFTTPQVKNSGTASEVTYGFYIISPTGQTISESNSENITSVRAIVDVEWIDGETQHTYIQSDFSNWRFK